jgi:cation diffusion facilitator family transporter
VLPILPQRRSATSLRRAAEGAGVRTVAIAFVANLVIALAKLIAGLVSGSTAMLAEAAHSAADSANEVFLFVGLYRDRQPADADHPLGHGRERFLWAFLAAIFTFLIGGCLSIALAIGELKARHPLSGVTWAWVVLAISFLADGTSWRQSILQARRQAKEYGLTTWRYLFQASDPVVRAVVVEDTAGLIGLCVAAVGLAVSQRLGTNVPDSLASLFIGLLLTAMAFIVARPMAEFLVGRSVPEPLLEKLHAIFKEDPAVQQVHSLLATYFAPEEVIVAAKIRPTETLTGEQLAQAMDQLDHKIRSELPVVADVFIDVTASRAAGSAG